MSGRPPSLLDKYVLDDGTAFMTGVQALVRLPLEQRRADDRAGHRTRAFASGYPGSPLGGYDAELQRIASVLGDHGVVHLPALNEELAATAIMGTQLLRAAGQTTCDGVAGLWYGKGPGLDRASDAIRHANVAGTSRLGGAIALVGDDPTAKSSTIPSASQATLAALGLPVLHPGDVQDALDLGRHAIAMSRASGLWVGVKVATAVADGSGTVVVDRDRLTTAAVDGHDHEPSGLLLAPRSVELEETMYGARRDAAVAYAVAAGVDRITTSSGSDRIGIVASGKAWFDLMSALVQLGFDDAALRDRGVRTLKLAMIHPLDPGIVRRLATGLDVVFVIEEKRPFVEAAVRDVLYGMPNAPMVIGKRDAAGRPLLPVAAELSSSSIADALVEVLLEPHERDARRRRSTISVTALTTFPTRSAAFCSGCPHGTSTRAEPGALVGAGIGCHGMVLTMPAERVGTVTGITQMGGEGAQWLGMAPFVEREHLFQNVGDGTFFHSASLAIRAAVAARATITYKLLVNSAVAMTGGQSPVGAMPVPDLCRLLALEGVGRIIVTSDDVSRYRRQDLGDRAEVWSRTRFDEACRELAATPGVTVLLHDQECAAEVRRGRRRGSRPVPSRRIAIDERVCEGCGDCGVASGCLSLHRIDTRYGPKTTVDQDSCNLDYACVQGDCPSFVELRVRRRRRGPRRGSAAPALPEPPRPSVGDGWNVRIVGVGGTGVVTVNQILATAATAAGWHVRGLDQTGLAQKGGAVVSDLRLRVDDAAVDNRLGDGEADLLLGGDVLVAVDPRHLAAAAPERTVAVVSTTPTPTGAMAIDVDLAFPSIDALRVSIDHRSVAERNIYLDASAMSGRLLGTTQHANLILLGAAFQRGAVPIASDLIEAAIELNGVSVEANIDAFRIGRRAVHDPEWLASVTPERSRDDLDSMIRELAQDLALYQSPAYADRYLELVASVRAREQAATVGLDDLTTTVAKSLHQLMAYKDEYEVARLLLRAGAQDGMRMQLGEDVRVRWLLHPPVLRRLGLDRKLSFGPWFRPVLVALRWLRRLRGTVFDPFGHTEMRRLERSLVREYEAVVELIAETLTDKNHDAALELAGLPSMVRGYEQVKARSAHRYRLALGAAVARYKGGSSVGVPTA